MLQNIVEDAGAGRVLVGADSIRRNRHHCATQATARGTAEPDLEGDQTAPPKSTPGPGTTFKRSRDEVSGASGVRAGAHVVGANHVNPLQDGGGFGGDGAEQAFLYWGIAAPAGQHPADE